MLGVIFVLKMFRHYLLGTTTTVVIDYKALVYFLNKSNATRRIVWCIILLQKTYRLYIARIQYMESLIFFHEWRTRCKLFPNMIIFPTQCWYWLTLIMNRRSTKILYDILKVWIFQMVQPNKWERKSYIKVIFIHW